MPDAAVDRGSVLMLMPAAVLVVIMLGAIAVDSAVVFLAQRQLTDAAEAAANDAVTVLLDEHTLRAGQGYVIDVGRAESAVRAWLAVHDLPVDITQVTVMSPAPGALEIRLAGAVESVFATALPGGPETTVVTGRATAQAVALLP